MRWPEFCSPIAVDVGPAGVALCQLRRPAGLRRRRGGPALHRWAVIQDPLRERPDLGEERAAALDRVARLLSELEFFGRRAVVALKPPQVQFHALTIPEALCDAPRAQAATMLRFEAARLSQVDPETLEVDYWPLPAVNRAGQNVMVAAVQRAAAERASAQLDSLGLELQRIDAAPLALLRAAWHAAAGRPGGANERMGAAAAAGPSAAPADALWGVLDIGFSGALLALALGPVCVFVRPLTTSADAFTLAIVDALQVDYRTAELLKRQFAPPVASGALARAGTAVARNGNGCDGVAAAQRLVHEHNGHAQPLDDRLPDEVGEAIENILETRTRVLAMEIERAFSYVMETYPNAAPTALYLAGGGAKLAGLSQQLRALLGIDVQRLNPCARLSAAPGRPEPSPEEQTNLAVAVGLALEGRA